MIPLVLAFSLVFAAFLVGLLVGRVLRAPGRRGGLLSDFRGLRQVQPDVDLAEYAAVWEFPAAPDLSEGDAA